MRILATQETDWISRNPIVHHRLLEWLSTHGADVTVIDYDIDWAAKAGPLLQRRHEFAGIHKYFADSRIRLIRPGMIRIGLIARLSWLFGNWRELRTIFRNAKPDVVVAYGISNALVTLAASRAAGRPFVYHVMDALHTHAESFPVRAIARFIESLTMRHADRVVVVSHGLARYAAGMGAPPDRLTVIPIGVRRVDADPEAGARARARLGVGEGARAADRHDRSAPRGRGRRAHRSRGLRPPSGVPQRDHGAPRTHQGRRVHGTRKGRYRDPPAGVGGRVPVPSRHPLHRPARVSDRSGQEPRRDRGPDGHTGDRASPREDLPGGHSATR